MGRRERREAARLTRGSRARRRPDNLSDVARSWFLDYPNEVGRPSLKPEVVTWLKWLGFAAIGPVATDRWRRRGRS